MKSYKPPASFKSGRYVPMKVLGVGTYGQVIQCVDTLTNCPCAVKVAQRDPAYRRSALNEIRALQALRDNSDTVRMLDSFEEDGHVCIATELLDRNLFELLRARGYGPLSLRDVRRVGMHVLSALDALHSAGYMHCDIKPENVMLRLKSATPAAALVVNNNSNNSMGSPGALLNSHSTLNSNSRLSWATSSNSSNPTDLINSARQQQPQHPPAFYTMLGGQPPHSTGLSSAANATMVQPPPPLPASSVPLSIATASNTNNNNNNNSNNAAYHYTHLAANNNSSSNSSEADYYATPHHDPLYNFLTSDCFLTQQQQQLQQQQQSEYDRTCLIDFGAVRQFHENAYYDVQSLWYRSPEVLCGVPYTAAIDAWSVGCLLFELYTGRALFPGDGVPNQMSRIVELVGTPSETAITTGKNTASVLLALRSHRAANKGSSQSVGDNSHKLGKWVRDMRAAGMQRLRTHVRKQQQDQQQQQQPRNNAENGGVNIHYVDAADLEDSNPAEEEAFVQMLVHLLQPDEGRRMSCGDALRHSFFQGVYNTQPSQYYDTMSPLLASGGVPPMLLPLSIASMTNNNNNNGAIPQQASVTMYCSPVSGTNDNTANSNAGVSMSSSNNYYSFTSPNNHHLQHTEQPSGTFPVMTNGLVLASPLGHSKLSLASNATTTSNNAVAMQQQQQAPLLKTVVLQPASPTFTGGGVLPSLSPSSSNTTTSNNNNNNNTNTYNTIGSPIFTATQQQQDTSSPAGLQRAVYYPQAPLQQQQQHQQQYQQQQHNSGSMRRPSHHAAAAAGEGYILCHYPAVSQV